MKSFKQYYSEVVDTRQFPDLQNADVKTKQAFLKKGLRDNNPHDDKKKVQGADKKPWEIEPKKLKPTQSDVYIGKSLSMAIAGKGKGDIGTVISADNKILDGHHRWAAANLNTDPTKSGSPKNKPYSTYKPTQRTWEKDPEKEQGWRSDPKFWNKTDEPVTKSTATKPTKDTKKGKVTSPLPFGYDPTKADDYMHVRTEAQAGGDRIGGVKVDLPISDLVPVARSIGDALGNKRRGVPQGGDKEIKHATQRDVVNAIDKGKNMNPKFYNKGNAQRWVTSIGGEKELMKRFKWLKRNQASGSDIPSRNNMPVIDADKGQHKQTGQMLSKGEIDVHTPYAPHAPKKPKK